MIVKLIDKKGFSKEYAIKRLVPFITMAIIHQTSLFIDDIRSEKIEEIEFVFVKCTPESQNFKAIYKEERTK